MRIAIDVMASDHGPAVITRGALQALASLPDSLSLTLIGSRDDIESTAGEFTDLDGRFDIVETSQVIGAKEHPVEALKAKPESSLVKAVELVQKREADALVSAGSTGAQVAASTLMLRHLPGVKRAGIATILPSKKGNVAIIDVGANVNCKAVHLYQYAMMCSLYAQTVLDIASPRVGLVSVGEEKSKGSLLVKEVNSQLEKSDLHFVGNIEGHEVFESKADVVVCEGFMGNVILKISEGLVEAMFSLLGEAAHKGGMTEDSGFRKIMGSLKQKFDWKEIGGAQLLGVNGVSIIAHGRSNEEAIASAVRSAHKLIEVDLNGSIVSALEQTPAKVTD